MTNTSHRHRLTDLQLETKTFVEKNEIKPWLYHRLLKQKGFKIAIERSDNNKIIFKCKHKQTNLPCTFRIRANYSIKFNSWSLVVINENHNHDFTNLHVKPTRNKVSNRYSSKSKTIESIVKQMDSLINLKILNKKSFDDEDKMNLIESLTLKFINNNSKYLSDNFIQQLQKNHEKVINWCSIPLSPLLNEDEDVTNNDGANTLIENLIHLPGLNGNLMYHSNSNNIQINNLINNDDDTTNPTYHINTNTIQNQNNQLPSFNSIQNKLPLSPTNLPTLNNTTTLNPSHLLKSYGSSSLYLNDFKNNYNFPLNNLNILGGPIKGDLKNNNDNNW